MFYSKEERIRNGRGTAIYWKMNDETGVQNMIFIWVPDSGLSVIKKSGQKAGCRSAVKNAV